jgi:hypothetical protein
MISYPLSISPDKGLTVTTDDTREQILALIDCRFWERPMFTDFGVVDLTFDNLDPATIANYLAQMKVAIDYWIGTDCTVSLDSSSTDLEAGVLSVSIQVPDQVGPFIFTYSI